MKCDRSSSSFAPVCEWMSLPFRKNLKFGTARTPHFRIRALVSLFRSPLIFKKITSGYSLLIFTTFGYTILQGPQVLVETSRTTNLSPASWKYRSKDGSSSTSITPPPVCVMTGSLTLIAIWNLLTCCEVQEEPKMHLSRRVPTLGLALQSTRELRGWAAWHLVWKGWLEIKLARLLSTMDAMDLLGYQGCSLQECFC